MKSEYEDIVQIEDVLETKHIKDINYGDKEAMADYIISNLTEFNNSVLVKQGFRYIPYNEFHSGYNYQHFGNEKRGILPGKEQLENNVLFNIMKAMPKGAEHHTHLYTFIDFPKVIAYILENQD